MTTTVASARAFIHNTDKDGGTRTASTASPSHGVEAPCGRGGSCRHHRGSISRPLPRKSITGDIGYRTSLQTSTHTDWKCRDTATP